jgi:hypothetical protein
MLINYLRDSQLERRVAKAAVYDVTMYSRFPQR